MLRALSLYVGLITLLAGCDAEPAKPADARPATAAPDATRPADGGMNVPPAGTYELTVKVVADDCTPKYAPPAPRRVDVQGKAEAGAAKLNAPVIGLPPDGSNTNAQRSDFIVLPPAEPSTRTSATQCGPLEITTSLTSATREGFTLNFTTTYGPSRSDCATPTPASCTTKIEQTFKLVEFKCAAECFRGAKSVAPDQLEIDCRCP